MNAAFRLASIRLASMSTGVPEKREPLPAGRYWVDLFPAPRSQACVDCIKSCREKALILGPAFYDQNVAACIKLFCESECEPKPGDNERFNEWGKANGQFVRVLTTEQFAATATDLPRTWVLFETLKPLAWIKDFRRPNIAPPEVKNSDDTVQKPAPEKGLFDDFGKGGMPWYGWAALGVVGAVGVGYAVRSFR